MRGREDYPCTPRECTGGLPHVEPGELEVDCGPVHPVLDKSQLGPVSGKDQEEEERAEGVKPSESPLGDANSKMRPYSSPAGSRHRRTCKCKLQSPAVCKGVCREGVDW